MLFILNNIRQLWEILQFHLLFRILLFVRLKLVEHEILDNINLTLNRSLLVVHHILIFLLVLLVSKSDHGAEEDGKRLFCDVLFLQILSEDLSAALSHLVLVLSIVDFKNFKTLSSL